MILRCWPQIAGKTSASVLLLHATTDSSRRGKRSVCIVPHPGRVGAIFSLSAWPPSALEYGGRGRSRLVGILKQRPFGAHRQADGTERPVTYELEPGEFQSRLERRL